MNSNKNTGYLMGVRRPQTKKEILRPSVGKSTVPEGYKIRKNCHAYASVRTSKTPIS